MPLSCTSPQSCREVQGPLTWGSGLGVHSMAWGAAAAHRGSVDEQRGQPRASRPLPCLAALCHLDVVWVQFDVGTVVWQLRRRRCSQGTAGDWRAHPLGLGRLCVPAPRPSPSPPGWTSECCHRSRSWYPPGDRGDRDSTWMAQCLTTYRGPGKNPGRGKWPGGSDQQHCAMTKSPSHERISPQTPPICGYNASLRGPSD